MLLYPRMVKGLACSHSMVGTDINGLEEEVLSLIRDSSPLGTGEFEKAFLDRLI